jgi:hypothetical protein
MNYKALFRISSLILIAIVVLLPLASFAVTYDSKLGLVPCGSKTGNTKACTLSDLVILIDQIINFILFYLAAPLGTLSIAVGGVLMITAGGDTGQLERGKSIFYNTVIGFVIAFGAWLIVKAILSALVSNTTIANEIRKYLNF